MKKNKKTKSKSKDERVLVDEPEASVVTKVEDEEFVDPNANEDTQA